MFKPLFLTSVLLPCQRSSHKSLYLYEKFYILFRGCLSLEQICIIDIDCLSALLFETILSECFVVCIFRLIAATSWALVSHFERKEIN